MIFYLNKDSKKNIKYGNLPIHKYLKGGHYHIVVHKIDDKCVSVGLTSDKPNNKRNQELHKVYESNGKIARLKRNADFNKCYYYSKKPANFNVDIETEKKAIIIANNKLAKKK